MGVIAIDASSLFGEPSAERDQVDLCVLRCATTVGMVTITGLPTEIRFDTTARHRMLQIFKAPRTVLEGLAQNTRDRSRTLLYYGWFPPQVGRLSWYEGFLIGADVARGGAAIDMGNPLAGPTPMPAEAVVPGWREAVREHFIAMERVSAAVLRSLARGLGLSGEDFPGAFIGGASCIRLLRYPPRPPGSTMADADGVSVTHNRKQRVIVSEPHVDFGCLTLLVQDEAPGLQVRLPSGAWADVLPREGQIVVNFGRLLALWTSGRIVACEHRVLSPNRERFSIPFFYEPRLDYEITPLPLGDAAPFAPFVYGDHVWSSSPRLQRLFGDRPRR
jgi:isopenicillin N synthase-like dioxygenase